MLLAALAFTCRIMNSRSLQEYEQYGRRENLGGRRGEKEVVATRIVDDHIVGVGCATMVRPVTDQRSVILFQV